MMEIYGQTCGICSEEFRNHRNIYVPGAKRGAEATHCNHFLHFNCAKKLIKTRVTREVDLIIEGPLCPICKTVFDVLLPTSYHNDVFEINSTYATGHTVRIRYIEHRATQPSEFEIKKYQQRMATANEAEKDEILKMWERHHVSTSTKEVIKFFDDRVDIRRLVNGSVKNPVPSQVVWTFNKMNCGNTMETDEDEIILGQEAWKQYMNQTEAKVDKYESTYSDEEDLIPNQEAWKNSNKSESIPNNEEDMKDEEDNTVQLNERGILIRKHTLDSETLTVIKEDNTYRQPWFCEHPTCGRSFDCKSVYYTHRLTHTTSFICLTCQKNYNRASNLKRHQKSKGHNQSGQNGIRVQKI